MKLPHRTPEDSISLPLGVDFRDPNQWRSLESTGYWLHFDDGTSRWYPSANEAWAGVQQR